MIRLALPLLLLPLLLVPLLLPPPAVAAETPGAAAATAAVSAATGGSVTITGDNFVVDDPHHQAIFSGNVLVKHTQLTLNADKVVADYATEGETSIKSMIATGHVRIVTKDQTATGEKAVFDPKTSLLTLTGNVVVTTKSGQVESAALVVNVRKNTSTFSGGGKSGRVTGVFSSQ